jgi:hypothetical protein
MWSEKIRRFSGGDRAEVSAILPILVSIRKGLRKRFLFNGKGGDTLAGGSSYASPKAQAMERAFPRPRDEAVVSKAKDKADSPYAALLAVKRHRS